ncbi:MAG: DNA-3-methyladenine glycosylase I [Candidatus Schekmanbacteria bacterium]|nr:DNA-3-methyladenine glycosylase I [Candidatus Schekmanbacteria bacterium]
MSCPNATPAAPIRCPWVDLAKPDYVRYHDVEWGVPLRDSRLLFELLILEGIQAGLSWYTVLRKREHYRAVCDGFDPGMVAQYGDDKIEALLLDSGIIRNRAKVSAMIENARRYLVAQVEIGSFAEHLWRFVGGRPQLRAPRCMQDYRAVSPESDAMSRDLRRRGFKFVGSTICYAFMQAAGMVNDHAIDCFRREEILSGNDSREIPER